jgi:tRNA pseudouridine32 synthase/23S rRNA pseudouridine746 synthase/23S rRNA pseudouridine1911/1915/1917 synthase
MEYTANEEILLLDVLAQLAPDSSKTSQRNWIKIGRVTVDGRLVDRANLTVQKGQTVRLGNRAKPLPQHLRIVYEDKHIVVVDKPKGLLSVATHFETEKTVHGLLKEHYHPQRVYVIHRLDQDTSGVMLFGLSHEGYDRLKADFKAHALQRLYIALVEGHLSPDKGSWTSYLWEDGNYHVHSTQDPTQGEKAIKHFEVKGSSRKYSWVELTLETGKKNQIRIHCKEAGHPIAGDKKYGSTTNPLKRVCLHAHILAFAHPVIKQWMTFTSPVPEDFYRVVPTVIPAVPVKK